jgi:prepilin-type N-terminal cleavage/methylation domain-containing protein
MKNLKRKEGFTLIEVVVVMAIIAILALLVVGAITIARNVQKETVAKANAKQAQTLLEAKFAQDKAYPVIGTAAAPVAFNAVTAAQLGATLSASGCANYGGQLYSAANSYNITFYKADCSTAQSESPISN